MKYKILLGSFMIMNVYAYASGVKFTQISSQKDWTEVLEHAKKTNKLIFIDFYTDWCGWCKRMDKEVFAIDDVGSYFNQNFINLKIDAENENLGKGLAQEYRVEGYPSYVFIDGEKKVVSNLAGYQQKSQLLESARSALVLWKRLPELKAKAQKGNLSHLETRDLAVLVAKQEGTEAAQSYADLYLKSFKKELLLQSEDFEFATFFLRAVEGEVFDYFSKNYKKIAESVGTERVDEYKYILFEDNFMKAVAKKDEKALNDLISKLLPFYLDGATQAENDMLRFTMLSGFYERTENWQKFSELIEDFRDTKAEDKVSFIFVQSEKIALQIGEPQLIGKAIQWMQMATMQAKTFDNHFLLSILYVRNQNPKDAQTQLNLAKQLAKTQEDLSKINELQKYITP